MTDPYSILGVPKSATEAEIKKAYRKLAKELHPDKNKDNPKAAERFSNVTAAYDLLGDKDKRARFDRGEIDGQGNPASPFGGGGGFRGAGGSPFGGSAQGFRAGPGGQHFEFGGDGVDLGDILGGMFGGGGARQRPGFGGGGFGRQAPPPKGANIAYTLAVSFEDAAALKTQRITLADDKTIDLKLPKGVETGTQMKLAGKGQQGPGGAGDGVVTLEIKPHRFFTREGDNVRLDLPITLKEAVLGGPVKVPTVEGPVMLNITAGSSSGKVLRLKERGFTGKSGKRGDQLVRLMVHIPADDAALKAYAENADDSSTLRHGLGV
jgi:DnaJ-class molecular chaperone